MNKLHLARRDFLKFLAASPVFAGMAPWQLLASSPEDIPPELLATISDPDQALDVFDFQRAAEQTLPPAHYGYLATGTNNNETLRANREAFDRYYLRSMRMVDTSKTDTRLGLLGEELSSPIFIAPVGSQKAFHPEGEEATARAAKAKDHLQILSNVANTSIEDAIAIRGRPVWFQLYPTSDFTVAEKMVRRAEAAGARTLVLTVDLNSGSNRVALERYISSDTRDCTQCHDRARPDSFFDRTPMYFETQAKMDNFNTSAMTWDYIAQLRTITSMNIVVKGIVTTEDAAAAVQHGCDAVYVSNHGGRAEASGWGALSSLHEVVKAVAGAVPVMVDSGFRRGTDIFKALALGADAVGVGRPYIWGLAAFGQPGVEKVLEMLQAELTLVMAQMGTPALKDIGPGAIGKS